MCVSNRECYLKTTCGCVVVLVLSAHYEKEEDYCNSRLEVLVPPVDEKGPALYKHSACAEP